MKKRISAVLSFAMFLMILLGNSPLAASGVSFEQELSVKDMFEYAVATAGRSASSHVSSNVAYSATLDNGAGDKFDVRLYEFMPAATRTGENTYSKTFVYSTQPEYVTPYASNSMSAKEWDQSISVYGYLTVDYMRVTNSHADNYLLTRVTGGWERDDHTVSIVDRYVAYTCQYVFDFSQVTHRYPSSDKFTYDTGYSTYVPDDGTTSVVGAVSVADLSHGSSSRWELTTRVTVIGNDVGGIIVG